MRLHTHLRTRFAALCLLFGIAVIGVPSVQAQPPDAFERALHGKVMPAASPDAFERAVNAARSTSTARLDAHERGNLRPGLALGTPTPPAEGASPARFEWSDAAIGGALTLAVLALGTGLVVSLRRFRRVLVP